jgi:hypothetical protein
MMSPATTPSPAAIAATILLSAGIVFLAPASANAATTSLTLDCDSVPYHSQTLYVAPGDSYTFALTGFDTVYDNNAGTDIAVLNPAGDSYEVFSGDYIEFYDNAGTCGDYFDIEVLDAGTETVPSGSLLFTQDITISASPSEIVVTETSGGEHYLGGLPTCGLSTDIDGRHVYGTQTVTVTTAGTFTFRGMVSSPGGYYTGVNPYDPIGDPFLAVYESFDPSQPDNGLIGCNDDLNDIGAFNDAEYLADGTVIEGHQPYFSATLTPGTYTLVLLTWEDLGTTDFAAGYGPWENANFAIGAKVTRFQLWGPAGALALGSAAAGLANTGVDARIGVVGAALIGGGLLLGGVSVARRRRRRA